MLYSVQHVDRAGSFAENTYTKDADKDCKFRCTSKSDFEQSKEKKCIVERDIW